MKTLCKMILAVGLAGGSVAATPGLAANGPTTTLPSETPARLRPPGPLTVASASEADASSPVRPLAGTNAPADFPPGQGLRMQFRDVSLDLVLGYLSRAAGWTIHTAPGVSVAGKVDIWSAQPASKEEAFQLLQQMLNEHSYTAIREGSGRAFTIFTTEQARRRDVPVNIATNYLTIPRTAELVTEIIPVRSLNVVQLAKDLGPLLDTPLTAQESGNSLIMNDTQINVRRITQIVKALDSVSTSINSLRVFPLIYADAKTVSGLIKDLFPSANASTQGGNNSGGRQNLGGFMGPGGPGGPGGGFNPFGGGNASGGNTSEGHTPSAKVASVADDHSNSVIVSAPDDLMAMVADLIKSLDVNIEDVTAVRAFKLQNADPGEMVDLLASLYPDTTTSTSGNNNPFGGFFGPPGGFGGPTGQAAGGAGETSTRQTKIGRVVSAADRRTSSIVVTAAKSLMPQITSLIESLDAHGDRKQHVYSMSLNNAYPADVLQVLQEVFPASSGTRSGSASTSSTQSNPFTTRAQTMWNTQNSATSTSFGTSSGSSGAGGGTGGR